MSMHEDRILKISKMIKDKMNAASVPPKYTELIKRYKEHGLHNTVITMSLTILNLNAQEDYYNIANALKEIKGVVNIGDFTPKKISVTYNQHETSLEYIVYKISKLGYRYINRFCIKNQTSAMINKGFS